MRVRGRLRRFRYSFSEVSGSDIDQYDDESRNASIGHNLLAIRSFRNDASIGSAHHLDPRRYRRRSLEAKIENAVRDSGQRFNRLRCFSTVGSTNSSRLLELLLVDPVNQLVCRDVHLVELPEVLISFLAGHVEVGLLFPDRP